MTLSREQILNHDDLQRERVDIPEWGGSLYVRVMTGAERDWFEAGMATTGGSSHERLANIRARIAVVTCCAEDGSPIFSWEDVAALGRKSGAALDRIFEVARRLNRLTAEDVDELVGNSSGDRSDASGSGSPSPLG